MSALRLWQRSVAPVLRRSTEKAFVIGGIGLVRSLGREGIAVALARENTWGPEYASRYFQEFIRLPDLGSETDEALRRLECYGASQQRKPVVFLNAENDVLLFSKHRERLEKYFHIVLAPDELICSLVDKSRFAHLAKVYDLPVPTTRIPRNRDECYAAAEEIGYPCIVKPITQWRWHNPEVINGIGVRKAALISSHDDLERLLDSLPPIAGGEMIQEYIPGEDSQHFDFHAYFDQAGRSRGHLVVHKLRTHPIHFGMGCYVEYVDEPALAAICLDALTKIGYVGAANINLKRHSHTGKDYILEINPRFSISTILDWHCGVNLPLLQYCDALGLEIPPMSVNGQPRRWVRFEADMRAMWSYWKCGELTPWQWVRSYFSHPGKIEFHVLAWDDPRPLLVSWWDRFRSLAARAKSVLRHLFCPASRKGAK
ncbi:MAG: ATP-grasp domain-containing protein [Planctomycetia bacterium]|nr:ATP-grasp domain-containing protein [Planctomycetia bacterium]